MVLLVVFVAVVVGVCLCHFVSFFLLVLTLIKILILLA